MNRIIEKQKVARRYRRGQIGNVGRKREGEPWWISPAVMLFCGAIILGIIWLESREGGSFARTPDAGEARP